MKKIITLTVFTLFTCSLAFSQTPYNVVFDITSRDTLTHQAALRTIKFITDTYKEAKVEIVFYGQSLEMVTQNKSTIADGIIEFARKSNVQFKVCQVAMKRWKIDKDQLLPGVQTVPDGIYEIISKQAEGWGYIKIAN